MGASYPAGIDGFRYSQLPTGGASRTVVRDRGVLLDSSAFELQSPANVRRLPATISKDRIQCGLKPMTKISRKSGACG